MFQFQIPTSRPMTTAHLAQTMALLTLTTEELGEKIESELAANPALEIVEERRCPKCHRLLGEHGVCPVCSLPTNPTAEEPVVFLSPRDDFIPRKDYVDTEAEQEPCAPEESDLPTYVLRQIAPDLQNEERSIAAFLLTHLDEDGFLTTTLLDIAQYLHVSLEKVKKVQQLIQRADPIGVGSLDSREALLVQLDVLAEISSVPAQAKALVSDCLDLLSHHQYAEIAHHLGISQKQVASIGQFISDNLNPFPGRSHWGDLRSPGAEGMQVYHRPDIIINYLNENPENPLVVEIIMPLSGTLRVNPLFKQAVHEAVPGQKEELKGDLDKASLFVKCLQQRNHTMERLLSRVVTLQREFILHGDKFLQPVTRAQLSRELDVHESTISRAVANKAVQLPNKKIVPLAMFFDRSLNVRTVLKEIIDHEASPLSDSELVEMLSERGYEVARRTVAKYRSIEGILPAHLRKTAVQH